MAPDIPAPVDRLIAAVNDQDTEAFLACFGEQGVVDDWGREFTGLEAVRGWSDGELIGKQATLDVTGTQSRGDETVVLARVGGNGFNGPSTFTFTVDADTVSRMTIRA